jgi:hypothetical protein
LRVSAGPGLYQRTPGKLFYQHIKGKDMKITAQQLLNKAQTHMQARAATYDKPEGERSMAATVAAYNAITGQALTEANGWLLMAVLKMVRDNQRKEAHVDSVEDLVAYASLYGEARLGEVTKPLVDSGAVKADDDGWIAWDGGECPIYSGVIVKVEYKDGISISDRSGNLVGWNWEIEPINDNHIIAYCVVK